MTTKAGGQPSPNSSTSQTPRSRPCKSIHPTRIRNQAESNRIAALASHLSAPERDLLIAIYREGLSIRTVAQLQSIDHWELRRRVARLIKRLSTPTYLVAAQLPDDLDPTCRAVARECFIEGRTVRDAAARLNLTLYSVRRERTRAIAIAQAMRAAGRLDTLASPPHDHEQRRSA